MKVLVGLGNPGSKYAKTRHNIGWMFLDYLVDRLDAGDFNEKSKLKSAVVDVNVGDHRFLLVKPLTFMNNSGEAVRAVKDFYKLENSDFVIVYDDVDLSFGEVRYRESGSGGTHNGMKSVVQHMGDDIPRLRLGVDIDDRLGDLTDFVLANFTSEELNVFDDIFDEGLDEILNV